MRPTIEEVAMETARAWARRSTCLRRQVGCVLLDRKGRVLSVGYNGVASGMPHCNERSLGHPVESGIGGLVARAVTYPYACSGALSPSGTNLDGCGAIHAEQNALIQCRNPDAIHLAICTTAPCVTCVKLLAQTGCRRIVFAESYPHAAASEAYWATRGGVWEQIT